MATEAAANELKQQGALEASRDPKSSVTAEDAENKVLEEAKAAGVDAFRFDPDATFAEKKAQAREVSRISQCCGLASANIVGDRLFRKASILIARKAWPW